MSNRVCVEHRCDRCGHVTITEGVDPSSLPSGWVGLSVDTEPEAAIDLCGVCGTYFTAFMKNIMARPTASDCSTAA